MKRVLLLLAVLLATAHAAITYLDTAGRLRLSADDTVKVAVQGAISATIDDTVTVIEIVNPVTVETHGDTSPVHVYVTDGSVTAYQDVGSPYAVYVDDTIVVHNDSLPVKYSDGKIRASAMPYTYDIAEGNIAGHESWSKIGYNGDVDAEVEDMWAAGGQYVFPAAQKVMEIVSSSTNDSTTGTGVQSVELYYLDSSYTEKVDTIVLSGTTPVLTNANVFRVQNFRSLTVGTGGVAAGNIDVRDTSNTPIYGRISAGQNRARTCVWTVPDGKTLYVTSIAFSIGGTANTKSAVFTTVANYDNKAQTMRNFFLGYNEVVLIDDHYYRPLEVPTKLGARVDLKVRVTGLVANCVCTCALRGWLE